MFLSYRLRLFLTRICPPDFLSYFVTLVLTNKIYYTMYMTYNHNIFRAVGEFSPDNEWWGKCKQVPKVEVNYRDDKFVNHSNVQHFLKYLHFSFLFQQRFSFTPNPYEKWMTFYTLTFFTTFLVLNQICTEKRRLQIFYFCFLWKRNQIIKDLWNFTIKRAVRKKFLCSKKSCFRKTSGPGFSLILLQSFDPCRF